MKRKAYRDSFDIGFLSQGLREPCLTVLQTDRASPPQRPLLKTVMALNQHGQSASSARREVVPSDSISADTNAEQWHEDRLQGSRCRQQAAEESRGSECDVLKHGALKCPILLEAHFFLCSSLSAGQGLTVSQAKEGGERKPAGHELSCINPDGLLALTQWRILASVIR